jgi:hypothetical protein
MSADRGRPEVSDARQTDANDPKETSIILPQAEGGGYFP